MRQHNSFACSAWRGCCAWLPALAAALAVAVLPVSARGAGFKITPNYNDSITLSNPIFSGLGATTIASDAVHGAAIEAAINGAIATFEHTYSTPINVNISFAEMTSGLGASTTLVDAVIPYANYRAALASTATSANDFTALASLPAGTTEPVTGGTNVLVTPANAEALGFTLGAGFPTVNGVVLINPALVSYPGGPGISGHYDLASVVSHEMDEVLATGSALNDSPTTPIRAEDLFRYSAPGVRSFTTSNLATSYFSINGGATDVINFNQVGDGSDYGDWASSATPHVQDAFGTPGAIVAYGTPEITALDVLGYTVVPEPSTFVLAGFGLLALVCQARRRRRA